ncbi:MAG: ribonuclease HII [Candidatus Protochlamydia sp.]|nr:ribonuclease HII [Candidatus Protochlamydia sp.]
MSITIAIEESERVRLESMMSYEHEAYAKGYRCIAGIDEAGRGPLAGPVVAAICVLPPGLLIPQVDDSKKLTPLLREQLFVRLTNEPGVHFGVGIIEPEEIDRINIYQATIQAMLQALKQLCVLPDLLLVDGMPLLQDIPFQKVIKGDQLSQSIAAASIIAKVTRDRLLRAYDDQWPLYGFKQHKGYATPQHLTALQLHGPCPKHRKSFEPVKTMVA